MKARALSAFLASLCLTVTSAQSAIVYSPGPASQSPPLQYPPSRSVDLDSDGLADFSFWSYGPITTFNIPPSSLTWQHYVSAVGTNQMLIAGYSAFLQSFGAEISSNAPAGTIWGTPWFGAGLAVLWWRWDGREINGQPVYHGGWAGPLGDLGVAYLPVGFYAADGLHYGWIRVRLPSLDSDQGGFFILSAPVVVDWAYETCPDIPIRAGDIGSAGESVQFTVEWSTAPRSRDPGQDVSSGSFILTGNTLRGELSLAGQFSGAQVIGPGNQGKKADPVLDFGQPLVASTSHTAFFREATLTHSQIVKLLHGKYCVTVDNGALTGQILPGAPAR